MLSAYADVDITPVGDISKMFEESTVAIKRSLPQMRIVDNIHIYYH